MTANSEPARDAAMVRLNKLYTRTGDDGSTGLGDGSRRHKADRRVEVMGEVDETNAAIGMARLNVSGATDAILARVQNDLFDLGADLCMPDLADAQPRLRITERQVERLEVEIDAATDVLAPLTSFVLPGGRAGAAALHLARTVSRRAERAAAALNTAEPLNPHALTYLNRLSDLLFALARLENDGGTADVLWSPGSSS
jgi:cob(I)alamin adenosyltransferase